MPITLRETKGSPLTYAEGDANVSILDARTTQAWAMVSVEPDVQSGSGNAPEQLQFRDGIYAYGYVQNAMMESFSNFDVPLDWAVGTDIYAAIHWSPGNSTATGAVRWGLEFTYAAPDGIFGASSFQYILTSTDGTAYKHIVAESQPFPGSAASQNMRFLIRIFRDGANVADTFAGDAFIVGVDFYYQRSRFGTPERLPPYT
jgi:hypothetical protein